MYKCDMCGNEFETPIWKVEWEEHTELAPDDRRWERWDIPTCPSCGSDELQEGRWCDYCEEHISVEFVGKYECCEQCKNEAFGIINNAVEEVKGAMKTDYTNAKEFFLLWTDEERW